MSDDEPRGETAEETADGGLDVSRRGALKLAGGGLLAASGARVGYEVTGYGTVSGTNVTEQRLAPFARDDLRPRPFDLRVNGGRLTFDGETVAFETDGETKAAVTVSETTPEAAAETGEDHGVGAQLRELTADIRRFSAGDLAFEFSSNEAFFDRVEGATARPFTVAAFRGADFGTPDSEIVNEFAGVGPETPAPLVEGLAAGFRDHAHFDVARWIVRNVEDHLLLNTVPLGQVVAEPTNFSALVDGSTGLYCWEYTRRSLAAFHAVPPHRQSPPVFGSVVTDDRHNHMYTGLASVVRDGGDLVVPITFVDYSHSTMYDSYGLRWLFGSGVDAYDSDHRISGIRYTW